MESPLRIPTTTPAPALTPCALCGRRGRQQRRPCLVRRCLPGCWLTTQCQQVLPDAGLSTVTTLVVVHLRLTCRHLQGTSGSLQWKIAWAPLFNNVTTLSYITMTM